MARCRTVLFEVVRHIAWITINRREANNAVDSPTAAALYDAWWQASTSADVHGTVVIGAGVEAFSLGFDRSASASTAPPRSDCFTPPKSTIPLVAAVNGIACTEALDLVRSADFVVAAEHARFFNERPDLSGRKGPSLSAAEALAVGQVDRVVPIQSLRREAELAVNQLASGKGLLSLGGSAHH